MSEESLNIIINSFDQTTDALVLDRTWELTKDRITEEKARQLSINDRSSKVITYALSILTATSLTLTFFKETIVNIFGKNYDLLISTTLIILLIGPSLYILYLTLQIWNKASAIVDTHSYRTWNELDLAQVTLGSNANAYQRFMLKSAWLLIHHNESVTDKKITLYTQSLRLTKKAILALVTSVMISIIISSITIYDFKNAKRKTMSDKKTEPQTNQKPINPTPMPTGGVPLKKSIDIKPTPMPTKGRPLKESNQSNKK